MSKQNNNQTKQKNYVKVIALVLAFLMLAGTATIIFSLFASLGQDSHDDHEGHNHAAVQYVQTV